jgi:hypothetical protein
MKYGSIVALIPPAGRCGWPLLQLLFILNPVVLVGVGRIDHLGNNLVVRLQNQDGSGVLVLSAVVSSREHSDKSTSCESLESVHDTLVGPNDHVEVVLGKEALDSVGAELDDVSSLRWVSQVVCVYAKLTV